MQLYDYQQYMDAEIDRQWQSGARNVCSVLPTGAGKTVVFGNKMSQYGGHGVAIAHRQELVSQISMTLAKFGVKHDILAPKGVIRFIIQRQLRLLGKPFYDPDAKALVAGVQTLIRRASTMRQQFDRVGRWTIDECHHLLVKNQWGKAVELFPNANGLGVTATPLRADGQGLGSHHDGVFDVMIQGPTMRELIDRGFLCDYKIYAPPSNIDYSDVPIGASGDYVKTKLSAKFAKSPIIGDIVTHYKKFAAGKIGVTFVPSVPAAIEVVKSFNDAGIPAEVVTAKTPDHLRASLIDKLERRELLQLVNVDLFGEGFDLPKIEVISMARKTESYGLYVQQFGRPLRVSPGKEYAIIIDHVGNVARHGLPDRPRKFTLDRRQRRAKADSDPDIIPTKTCVSCAAVYEAIFRQCPYCEHVPVPEDRSAPEFVEGDLVELDAETLAAMRAEVARVDLPASVIKARMEHGGASGIVAGGAAKQHKIRQVAQTVLRACISQWAGYQRAVGRPDSEIYRRFYFRFGVDIMTAQALGRPAAENLTARIVNNYEVG